MIRTILAFLEMGIFFIVSLPAVGYFKFVRAFFPKLQEKQAMKFMQWEMRPVLFICGTRMHVSGLENLSETETVVYAGNHRSLFDVPCMYIYLKKPVGFVGKKEMQKVPLLPLWFDLSGSLYLDRENVKAGLKTILQAIQYVVDGRSMVIYPEGTRNKSENPDIPLEFKEGSLKMAQKGHARVVPVAIKGTENIFENHFPWIRPADVYLHFGEPIDLTKVPEEYRRKPAAYVRKIIEAKIAEF